MVQQPAKRPGLAPPAKQLRLMVAGGVAGAIAKTCTAPLGRLTILYQLQSFEGQRPSVRQALVQVVQKQGIRSLWRGHMATLLHRVPYSAVNFAVFENSVKALTPYLKSVGDGGSVATETARYLIAGGLGGSVGCAFAYPLDLVKTRLAGQLGGKAQYRGVVDCIGTIIRQEGFFALYRGLSATLLQVTPMLAINFASYELVKRYLIRKLVAPLQLEDLKQRAPAAPVPGADRPIVSGQGRAQSPGGRLPSAAEARCSDPARCASSSLDDLAARASAQPSSWEWASPSERGFAQSLAARRAWISLLAGSLSGVISSTVTFPLDVVRRNLQMKSSQRMTYMECVRLIYKKGGWRGFYAGLIPEYMKVVPSVSIAFCSYEFLKASFGLS